MMPSKAGPTKALKRPRGRTGGGIVIAYRNSVSQAGVLRFPDTPIICLKVSDDIDAVIWVKNDSIISTLFLT